MKKQYIVLLKEIYAESRYITARWVYDNKKMKRIKEMSLKSYRIAAQSYLMKIGITSVSVSSKDTHAVQLSVLIKTFN